MLQKKRVQTSPLSAIERTTKMSHSRDDVINKTFESYSDFTNFLKQYMEDTGYKLSVYRSKTIEAAKKDGLKRKIKQDLKFYYKIYTCPRSGQFESKGTGKKKISSQKTNCQASMTVNVTATGSHLIITSCNEQHNHTLSQEAPEQNRDNSKPSANSRTSSDETSPASSTENSTKKKALVSEPLDFWIGQHDRLIKVLELMDGQITWIEETKRLIESSNHESDIGMQRLKNDHTILKSNVANRQLVVRSVEKHVEEIVTSTNVPVPQITNRLTALNEAFAELLTLVADRDKQIHESSVCRQFLAKVEQEETAISEMVKLISRDDCDVTLDIARHYNLCNGIYDAGESLIKARNYRADVIGKRTNQLREKCAQLRTLAETQNNNRNGKHQDDQHLSRESLKKQLPIVIDENMNVDVNNTERESADHESIAETQDSLKGIEPNCDNRTSDSMDCSGDINPEVPAQGCSGSKTETCLTKVTSLVADSKSNEYDGKPTDNESIRDPNMIDPAAIVTPYVRGRGSSRGKHQDDQHLSRESLKKQLPIVIDENMNVDVNTTERESADHESITETQDSLKGIDPNDYDNRTDDIMNSPSDINHEVPAQGCSRSKTEICLAKVTNLAETSKSDVLNGKPTDNESIRDPKIINLATIVMPVIRGRGRPRGRVTKAIGLPIQKVRKPVPFEERTQKDQDRLLLSWILPQPLVGVVLTGEHVINDEDLTGIDSKSLKDGIVADSVRIDALKQYFVSSFFKILKKLIKDKKKNKQDYCGVCGTSTNDTLSVFCNSCLVWNHYSCVGVQRKPRMTNWFCPRCIQT